MKTNTFLIALIFALTGCATNSGIVSLDKNNYYISISSPQLSFGPPIKQKAQAYEEASQFCATKQQGLKTVDLKELPQVFGRHASVELTFSCEAK